MYGPVASKVAVWIMIVLGCSTWIGAHILAQELPTGRDFISIGVFIFGVGAAWTSVKDDLKTIRTEFKAQQNITDLKIQSNYKLISTRFTALSDRISKLEHPPRYKD